MLEDEIQCLGVKHAPRPSTGGSMSGFILHVEKCGDEPGYQMMFRKSNTNTVLVGRRPPSQEGNKHMSDPSRALFRCPVVSRTHAQFTFSDSGSLYITDTSSHHGTHIRKPRELSSTMIVTQTPVMLHDGDVITFGKSVGKNNEVVRPIVARVELIYIPPAPISHSIAAASSSPVNTAQLPKTPTSLTRSTSSSGRYGLRIDLSSDDSSVSSSSSSEDMDASQSPSSNEDSDSVEIVTSASGAMRQECNLGSIFCSLHQHSDPNISASSLQNYSSSFPSPSSYLFAPPSPPSGNTFGVSPVRPIIFGAPPSPPSGSTFGVSPVRPIIFGSRTGRGSRSSSPMDLATPSPPPSSARVAEKAATGVPSTPSSSSSRKTLPPLTSLPPLPPLLRRQVGNDIDGGPIRLAPFITSPSSSGMSLWNRSGAMSSLYMPPFRPLPLSSDLDRLPPNNGPSNSHTTPGTSHEDDAPSAGTNTESVDRTSVKDKEAKPPFIIDLDGIDVVDVDDLDQHNDDNGKNEAENVDVEDDDGDDDAEGEMESDVEAGDDVLLTTTEVARIVAPSLDEDPLRAVDEAVFDEVHGDPDLEDAMAESASKDVAADAVDTITANPTDPAVSKEIAASSGVSPRLNAAFQVARISQQKLNELRARVMAMGVRFGSSSAVDTVDKSVDASMASTTGGNDEQLVASEAKVEAEVKVDYKEIEDQIVTMKKDILALQIHRKKYKSCVNSNMHTMSEKLSSLGDIKSDIGDMQVLVDGIRGDVETTTGDIEMVRGDIDSVRNEVEGNREDFDEMKEDVEWAKGDVDFLRREFDYMSRDFDGMREDVDALRDDVDNVRSDLTGHVDGLQLRINDMQSAIDLLEDEKEAQVRELSDESLQSLVAKMRTLHESSVTEMEALKEARRQAEDDMKMISALRKEAEEVAQAQAATSPPPSSLKRKRVDDTDDGCIEDRDRERGTSMDDWCSESEEHWRKLCAERVNTSASENSGAPSHSVASSSSSIPNAETTTTTTTNVDGVRVPPTKRARTRARKVVSVMAQTATAVTIGAVATWTALAFS